MGRRAAWPWILALVALALLPRLAIVVSPKVDLHGLRPGKETAVFIPACLVVAGFLVANVFVMKALVNIKV